MDLQKFNSLCQENKDMILGEMFELYSLIEKYPVIIDDLKIFSEWNSVLGKHGNSLKEFLVGIYPVDTHNYTDEELYELSNEALRFVTHWNDIAHTRKISY